MSWIEGKNKARKLRYPSLPRFLPNSICWNCTIFFWCKIPLNGPQRQKQFHIHKEQGPFYLLGRAKRICFLSPMRAAKVQASLRIRAVSPEPPLLAHTSSESRGTFRQKARSIAPLNGWACAIKICHDGMLEDTNSLDAALFIYLTCRVSLLLVDSWNTELASPFTYNMVYT